eukprot:CAMPEP_0185023794 /NCGR_PEP_ID=MMETSP1103-20130426/6416_1 /TAXON_ID=36769 /ORGANISM="Paraphysomonas bandaiensis, Strain Caron Lab Isolate" /LENGTH=266 /DNA_ID=CAMNT_0027556545 /DNA_START=78 /DNA_END=875 /DNA_ORIENTATION=+
MKLSLVLIGVACVIIALFCRSDSDALLSLAGPVPKDSFQDRVIWITGASSGLGEELALRFCKAGAKVIISARRENKLKAVAASCTGSKHDIFILPLDAVNATSHSVAYKSVIDKYGKVDMLVLNAGRSQRSAAMETPYTDTKALMELNFLSYVHLANIVLPGMVSSGGGQLVVMSSLSGKLATPVASSYSASKYALHGYFDALRAEMSINNISVTIVCPGPVESDIHLHTVRKPGLEPLDEGKKMPTARFAVLAEKAIYHKFDEVW